MQCPVLMSVSVYACAMRCPALTQRMVLPGAAVADGDGQERPGRLPCTAKSNASTLLSWCKIKDKQATVLAQTVLRTAELNALSVLISAMQLLPNCAGLTVRMQANAKELKGGSKKLELTEEEMVPNTLSVYGCAMRCAVLTKGLVRPGRVPREGGPQHHPPRLQCNVQF
eukprot:161069-Rhodomonas_salina.4